MLLLRKALAIGQIFLALPGRSTPSAEFHAGYPPGKEKHEKMAQFGKGNYHQHELAKKHVQHKHSLIIKILVVGQITGHKGGQAHSQKEVIGCCGYHPYVRKENAAQGQEDDAADSDKGQVIGCRLWEGPPTYVPGLIPEDPVGQQEKRCHQQAEVKYEPDCCGDRVFLGRLIKRHNPMKDREPEPFPTEKTIYGLIFLGAQGEEQDDPHHHTTDKHPKSQPEQGSPQQFIEAHGFLLLILQLLAGESQLGLE
jgi:hypothetical protein